jgi:hypothetical protein
MPLCYALQIEVVGIAFFCAAAAAGNRAVIANYSSRVQDGIGAISEAFTKKTEQIQWCLQCNVGVSAAVHALLASNGTSSSADTLALLQHIQALYQVEHFALLGTSKQILATVNAQSRLGEVADPEGIVTAAQAARGVPVWTYGTLTYADLMKEAPPLFRDRASDVDMAEKGNHPYESKKDSVIRWMALAIRYIDTSTWEPAASDAAIIGYLLVGGQCAAVLLCLLPVCVLAHCLPAALPRALKFEG